MPDRPTDAGSFAEAVYTQLEPLTYAEDRVDVDYALLKFVGALGQMFQQYDHLAHSDEAGGPWSKLLDIDRIPCEGLPWLGQFIGVQVNASLTCDEQRQQIRDHESWNRGTPEALRIEIQKCLTGTKTVHIIERYPDPYSFHIITYGSVEIIATISYQSIWEEYTDYHRFLAENQSYPDPYQSIQVHYGETYINSVDYQFLYNSFGTYSAIYLQYDTYDLIWLQGSGTSNCVVAAINRSKPAGLVYSYEIVPGDPVPNPVNEHVIRGPDYQQTYYDAQLYKDVMRIFWTY